MPPIELTNSAKIALAISAAFPLGAGAAPAGRIDFAVGNVTARLADGSSRPLAKGAEIHAGETIDTGDGRAQLRYSDGSQVSLRPGTQYRIDDYKFNGKNDGEEKAFFSLIKGGFRTITGLIGKGNREAYKVTTATATIGIRGTEFVVLSDQNGITISTGEGLVQVCNAGGCIVLASGEAAVVADKDGKPVRIINTGPAATSDKPSTPSVVVEKQKEEEVKTTTTTTTSPTLASGPGYAMAWAGKTDYGEYGAYNQKDRSSKGTANFAAGTTLSSFVADGGAFDGFEGRYDGGAGGSTQYGAPTETIYSKTLVAGADKVGFTDGTIGWGRWSSATGSNEESRTFSHVHYVVGMPTEAMPTNVQGTYTWLGGTAPTSTTGKTGDASTLSGSLTANFATAQVTYSIDGIKVGSFDGRIQNATATINGFTFQGQSNSVVAGGACAGSGCSVRTAGLFVGTNAARAGLSYSINTGNVEGVVQGAAVFKAPSTFTAAVPPT